MAKFLQCRGCGGNHIKSTRSQTNKLCLLACVEGDNRCKSSHSNICYRSRKSTSCRPQSRPPSFTEKQEELVIKLHRVFGNQWSLIAREVPGKRAEDIRNLCRRKHIKKKLQSINDEPAAKVAFVNEDKDSDEEKGNKLNMIDLNELPSSEEYMEDFVWNNQLSFDLNQVPPEAEVII